MSTNLVEILNYYTKGKSIIRGSFPVSTEDQTSCPTDIVDSIESITSCGGSIDFISEDPVTVTECNPCFIEGIVNKFLSYWSKQIQKALQPTKGNTVSRGGFSVSRPSSGPNNGFTYLIQIINKYPECCENIMERFKMLYEKSIENEEYLEISFANFPDAEYELSDGSFTSNLYLVGYDFAGMLCSGGGGGGGGVLGCNNNILVDNLCNISWWPPFNSRYDYWWHYNNDYYFNGDPLYRPYGYLNSTQTFINGVAGEVSYSNESNYLNLYTQCKVTIKGTYNLANYSHDVDIKFTLYSNPTVLKANNSFSNVSSFGYGVFYNPIPCFISTNDLYNNYPNCYSDILDDLPVGFDVNRILIPTQSNLAFKNISGKITMKGNADFYGGRIATIMNLNLTSNSFNPTQTNNSLFWKGTMNQYTYNNPQIDAAPFNFNSPITTPLAYAYSLGVDYYYYSPQFHLGFPQVVYNSYGDPMGYRFVHYQSINFGPESFFNNLTITKELFNN
jgi:hypothetical protein